MCGLVNQFTGRGLPSDVPTQRAARIWTIAPHRQTPYINSPVAFFGFLLRRRPDRQCTPLLYNNRGRKPFPTGSIGRKVGHGAGRVHTHPTPHPGLCFHWVWFSRLPYRVTVQTHSYFACVVRRGQATRPLHTGNGVTQPVIRPHGPALDTRLSRSSAFASNRDAPHSTPDACCLLQSKQRMGRRRVATSP